MTILRRLLLTLALCFLAPVWMLTAQESPSSAPAEADSSTSKVVREEWMIALMQGKRCGYGSVILRERDTPAGKQYITDSSQEFKFARQGQELHIISRSSVVETEQGVVVSFQSQTSGGGSDVTARGYRVGEEMVIISGNQKTRVPMPKNALGPEALDRKTSELKFEAGQGFTSLAFMTDFVQRPVTVTASIVGQESREIRGKTLQLWKATMQIDALPGLTTVAYVNDQSRAELTIIPFPGLGELQLITTTRAEAMKELESIEVFNNSIVTPLHPLTDLKQRKSATFKLTNKGDQTLPLWSGPGQQVFDSKPGEATIRVTTPDITEKTPTWQLPHAPDAELKPYLEPSTYVERTARLEALAAKAVGPEKNPVLAAHQIESFVRSYIRNKDLSIGFASADETAASAAGDCTEHAVLCAALGRAVGLPTRLVVGFGYLPGVGSGAHANGLFGFHMWAEAWIGPDQWYPMDAALNGFDVGHIAIAKTALQEVNPMAELTMPVLNLMQSLQIDVLPEK